MQTTVTKHTYINVRVVDKIYFFLVKFTFTFFPLLFNLSFLTVRPDTTSIMSLAISSTNSLFLRLLVPTLVPSFDTMLHTFCCCTRDWFYSDGRFHSLFESLPLDIFYNRISYNECLFRFVPPVSFKLDDLSPV